MENKWRNLEKTTNPPDETEKCNHSLRHHTDSFHLTWLMRRCIQAMDGSSYSVLPLSSCTRLGSCLETAAGVGHTVLTMLGLVSAASPSAPSVSFSETHTSSCMGRRMHHYLSFDESPTAILATQGLTLAGQVHCASRRNQQACQADYTGLTRSHKATLFRVSNSP